MSGDKPIILHSVEADSYERIERLISIAKALIDSPDVDEALKQDLAANPLVKLTSN